VFEVIWQKAASRFFHRSLRRMQAHLPAAAGGHCGVHSRVGTLQWAGTCPPKSWAVRFVRVLAQKMLNFPPEVVIWWTLKMYFWEIVIHFLLHYCIVMQTIWRLKFWKMTKCGGQFALASPLQILGDSFPRAPWFTPMDQQKTKLWRYFHWSL